MSDAIRQGVSQLVDDFVGSPGDEHNTQSSSIGGTSTGGPPSPTQRKKRIHMPAGFPGYTPSIGNTPMDTPLTTGREDQPPMGLAEDYPDRSRRATGSIAPTASTTARPAQVPPSVSASSQFRFRGQFAGPQGTSGLGTELGSDQRRVGVLNAR
jgi:hypothetical protein